MHGDIIVKVTPNQLREIVKEELKNFLAEKKDDYAVFDSEKEAKAYIAKQSDGSGMKIKKKGDKFKVITDEDDE